MRASEFPGPMGFKQAEKIQIPGMNEGYMNEFHARSVRNDNLASSLSEFYIPPSLKDQFPLVGSSTPVRHEFTSTPIQGGRSEWVGGSLSIPMPPPSTTTRAHESVLSPSSWERTTAYVYNNGESSRPHSVFGDCEEDRTSELEGKGATPAQKRRLQRQMSRSSIAGVARSNYGASKSFKQRLRDVNDYETGIFQSLLPLKAAIAATLASIISFAPFLPEMLRLYGTTAVVGVGMTLEPTVGQTLQKGYNLALGSALAACCAFAVFRVEQYTGEYRVFFLIICAFLGGCLPRMYNLQAVIKSRWGQVVSYYISVFHGLVLWNPLTKKQTSQFLFNCMCYSIGFMMSFTMGLCIKPDYAGDTLLTLLVRNFNTVGDALERIVEDYEKGTLLEKAQELLRRARFDHVPNDIIHGNLTFIINSNAEADKLITAVYWEPPHGKFYAGYPWAMYPKLLQVLLHVTYDLLALDSCLRGEIQAPVKVRQLFAEDMELVARECALLFHKIADALEKHQKLDYHDYVSRAKVATRRLRANLSRFSALVIAQDFPIEYSRSTSISSARDDDFKLAAEHAVFAAEMMAQSASATPVDPPSSPQRSERSADQDLEASHLTLPHDDNWRNQLFERQRSIHAHWGETTARISSLSFLKFASILIELMAKVKAVVLMVDEFAIQAKFKE